MMQSRIKNRNEWVTHSLPVALATHSLLLASITVLLHPIWAMIVLFEVVCALFIFLIEIGTPADVEIHDNLFVTALSLLLGVPWILGAKLSVIYETLKYREIIHRSIELKDQRTRPSFYEEYQGNLAMKFLYTSLHEYMEIEFEGEIKSVQNYGTIVYEQELYAVFIPSQDNHLYIAKIDKDQERLILPPKETYDYLFHELQKK